MAVIINQDFLFARTSAIAPIHGEINITTSCEAANAPPHHAGALRAPLATTFWKYTA